MVSISNRLEEAFMNLNYRPAVITVGFAAVALFAPNVTAQSTEKPNLRVENATIDAGKVIAGEPASVTYVFHNDGPTDITILRASPS
jgi:hypothetical protein